MPVTYFHLLPSPLGQLLLTSDGQSLTGVHMDATPHADFVADPKVLATAVISAISVAAFHTPLPTGAAGFFAGSGESAGRLASSA